MNKKYFFFDIDGTLTDLKTQRIVPSAKLALKQLEENGHFVSIATGRIHYKTVAFTDKIDIHNLVCSGGGCLVINDEIIKNEPLPLEKAKSILRTLEEEERGWLLLLEDNDNAYMKDFRFLEQAGLRRELTSYKYDPNLNFEDLDEIFKIYAVVNRDEDKDKLPWINTLSYLGIEKDYIVIQHDRKKDGILDMMEYLGAPLEDVVVFGDDCNDLVMFDDRWTSIAMGSGPDILKEKADYVTKSSVEDGVYEACKHFGWI